MDAGRRNLYDSNMDRDSAERIRTYNLFGEQGALPDVVHCETIAARSRLHDWVFAPHRHAGLHQALLLERGGGRASLDGKVYDLAPMTLANVPVGVVHDYAFTPGSDGYVVTLATEILDQTLRPEEGLRRVLSEPAVLAAGPEPLAMMREIMGVFEGRAFARAQVLRSLSGLLLGRIAQALVARETPAETRAAPALLARFEALLDTHFAEHWRVRDYAAALAVSPTHLSRVVREATGRPATGVIEERVVREARRHLAYTNLAVSTIAYALGFEDPAYFSRVFARATGASPRAFRARALAAAD
jgi:AraC family transcriptional activator of pobA